MEHNDLIEEYIFNRLTEAERKAFEARLDADPALVNELAVQQDMAEALRAYRRNELKNRLRFTNTDGWLRPLWVDIARVAAVVLVAGMAGYTWYYLKSDRDNKALTPEVAHVAVRPAELKAHRNAQVIPDSHTNPTQQLTNTVAGNTANTMAATTPKSVVVPQVIPPVPGGEFKTFEFNTNEGTHHHKTQNTQISAQHKVSVEVVKDSEFKFHYSYYSEKLYLYGSFGTNGKTYELIELNKGDRKLLYLYYNHHYYLLTENQVSPKPLVEITDKLTVQELERYKNN